MNERTNALGVVVFALFVATSAGAWTAMPASGSPSAEQTRDRANFTVHTGAISVDSGGRICAERVDGDTNRLVLEDVELSNVTIYQPTDDVNQQTRIEHADVEGKVVLLTDGNNEKVNTLAESGQCIGQDQENVVLQGYRMESTNLSTSGVQIIGGEAASADAPSPGGLTLPPGLGDNATDVTPSTPVDTPGPASNVTLPTNGTAGRVTDTANETVGDATDRANGTTETVRNVTNGTTDRVTDRTNDTVDTAKETVDDATNGTTDTVNSTVDETKNTVNSTVDETKNTVNSTVDETKNTVNDTTDGTTDTVNNTANETDGTVSGTADTASTATPTPTPSGGGTSDDGLLSISLEAVANVLG